MPQGIPWSSKIMSRKYVKDRTTICPFCSAKRKHEMVGCPLDSNFSSVTQQLPTSSNYFLTLGHTYQAEYGTKVHSFDVNIRFSTKGGKILPFFQW